MLKLVWGSIVYSLTGVLAWFYFSFLGVFLVSISLVVVLLVGGVGNPEMDILFSPGRLGESFRRYYRTAVAKISGPEIRESQTSSIEWKSTPEILEVSTPTPTSHRTTPVATQSTVRFLPSPIRQKDTSYLATDLELLLLDAQSPGFVRRRVAETVGVGEFPVIRLSSPRQPTVKPKPRHHVSTALIELDESSEGSSVPIEEQHSVLSALKSLSRKRIHLSCLSDGEESESGGDTKRMKPCTDWTTPSQPQTAAAAVLQHQVQRRSRKRGGGGSNEIESSLSSSVGLVAPHLGRKRAPPSERTGAREVKEGPLKKQPRAEEPSPPEQTWKERNGVEERMVEEEEEEGLEKEEEREESPPPPPRKRTEIIEKVVTRPMVDALLKSAISKFVASGDAGVIPQQKPVTTEQEKNKTTSSSEKPEESGPSEDETPILNLAKKPEDQGEAKSPLGDGLGEKVVPQPAAPFGAPPLLAPGTLPRPGGFSFKPPDAQGGAVSTLGTQPQSATNFQMPRVPPAATPSSTAPPTLGPTTTSEQTPSFQFGSPALTSEKKAEPQMEPLLGFTFGASKTEGGKADAAKSEGSVFGTSKDSSNEVTTASGFTFGNTGPVFSGTFKGFGTPSTLPSTQTSVSQTTPVNNLTPGQPASTGSFTFGLSQGKPVPSFGTAAQAQITTAIGGSLTQTTVAFGLNQGQSSLPPPVFGGSQPLPKPLFRTSQPPTTASSQPPTSVLFGGSKPQTTTTFSTGQEQTITKEPSQPQVTTSAFIVSQSQTTTFGANQSQITPMFGTSKPNASPAFGMNLGQSTLFGGSQPQSVTPFSGSQPQTTTAFGGSQPQTTTAFGGSHPQTTTAFGGSQPQTTTAFGGTLPQTTISFGSSQSQATTFATSTPQTTTAFGSSQPQTTTAFGTGQVQKPIAFGGNQAQSPPIFGSVAGKVGTTQASIFGAGSNQGTSLFAKGNASGVPSFGAQTFGAGSNQTPTFGVGRNQTPTFGAASNQAPNFASPINQTPTFGAAPNQTPTFGATPVQTPTFGATPNQTPTFGATPSQTRAFGATASQTTTFGMGANQTPTFGASANQTPTFGSGTAATGGIFGAAGAGGSSFTVPRTQASGAPLAFGPGAFGSPAAAPAPTFGATALGQAAQSGSGFGSPAATPSFGQPQQPAPAGGLSFGATAPAAFGSPARPVATPSKSFNFSGGGGTERPSTFTFGQPPAATGSAAPFRFESALPSTPPNPGGQAMFSIGSGSTAPRSRALRTRRPR